MSQTGSEKDDLPLEESERKRENEKREYEKRENEKRERTENGLNVAFEKKEETDNNTEAEDDVIKTNCDHFKKFLNQLHNVGFQNISPSARREITQISEQMADLQVRSYKNKPPKYEESENEKKNQSIKNEKDKYLKYGCSIKIGSP